MVFEVAVDPDDIGMIELGERLGLGNEAVETPLVVALAVLGLGTRLVVLAACRVVARKILLDRHAPIERGLDRQIGDAEAARAENALDLVVRDQLCSRLQRQQVGHFVVPTIADG